MPDRFRRVPPALKPGEHLEWGVHRLANGHVTPYPDEEAADGGCFGYLPGSVEVACRVVGPWRADFEIEDVEDGLPGGVDGSATPGVYDQINAALRDKLADSGDNPQVYDLVKVVRAVMREHAVGADVNGREVCAGCSGTYVWVFWPCETVRTIAHELRIEAPRG